MSDSAPQEPAPAQPEPGARHRPQLPATPRGWLRWLPGLQIMREYQIGWLRHDVMAGLALTAVLVPVGIAYAVASGLPAICGLYATIFGLLAYAVFGPSRVLVLGPDSSLVALVIGVVLPLSGGDPARAMSLAAMLALVSGTICVLAGSLRLGFVTELLSKPIRYGYMNGIALTVIVSQLPAFFGFKIDSAGLLQQAWAFLEALAQGRTNLVSLGLACGTSLVILVFRRRTGIPGVLVAVAGATLLSAFLEETLRAGVDVVGALPQGLPAIRIPLIRLDDIAPVLLGGVAVALVSFADTSVLARSYAARTGDLPDPNREMVGLGAANLAAGLFQGFPVSASASRTPVAEMAGAKTQLTGVVGALAVCLLLVLAPNLLASLPRATLAAVVIASACALVEVSDLRRIYRIQQWEFWLSMGCFAGVALFGAIPGIGLAIVAAVIEFLWDGWRPHFAVLGRVEGMKGYHDLKRYPDARQVPGLLLFRWDAPLFFANAELFQKRVLEAVGGSPTPVRRVIVAAEPVTSIDVTSADVLAEMHAKLRAAGIELHFAEMKDPVKEKLVRFELMGVLGTDNFHPTVGAAVDDYLERHQVDWKP